MGTHEENFYFAHTTYEIFIRGQVAVGDLTLDVVARVGMSNRVRIRRWAAAWRC